MTAPITQIFIKFRPNNVQSNFKTKLQKIFSSTKKKEPFRLERGISKYSNNARAIHAIKYNLYKNDKHSTTTLNGKSKTEYRNYNFFFWSPVDFFIRDFFFFFFFCLSTPTQKERAKTKTPTDEENGCAGQPLKTEKNESGKREQ